jgi:cytochrome c oxidase subunit 2
MSRPRRRLLKRPLNRATLARTSFVVSFGLALAACSGASPSAISHSGTEASDVTNLWWVMFGLAVVVYIVVATLIVWAIVHGRGGRGPRANFNDNKFIWIGGVIAPAIILFVLGVLTMTTSNAIRQPSNQALVVDVQARDWWWNISYPGKDVRTANEIHVPVDTKIHFQLTSVDVIHSFWVPQIAGKEDVIPGQPNDLFVTVRKTGTYRGLCAEFCGIEHAHMDFYVIAESPGDFAKWVEANAQPAQEPLSEVAERGQVVFQRSDCAGCHTIRGTTANGTVGPDLTHVGSRSTLGALTIENTPENLHAWVENPGNFKPGVKMPPSVLSKADLEAVVAYLQSRK